MRLYRLAVVVLLAALLVYTFKIQTYLLGIWVDVATIRMNQQNILMEIQKIKEVKREQPKKLALPPF